MKHSPYIQWAKQLQNISYNLAGSGMPAFPLPRLVDDPSSILQSGEHEDGWPPLMERIARRYEVSPDQVVLVESASMANHLVCGLLLEAGDEVIIEDPVYEPLKSVPRYYRANIHTLPRKATARFQPAAEAAEKRITRHTRLMILSDMHNPTGAKLEPPVLEALVELAEIHDFHLLVDEVYLEFLYAEGERTAASRSGRVITTRSLTKAFGLDDIRIGWIIAEASIAERLRRLKDLFSTTLAFPSERLGAAALDRADAILAQHLELINRNRGLVRQFIDREPALSWIAPPTGTVGFVRYANGNVDPLVDLARRRYETAVVPGRFFGRSDHFRIGWGLPTETLKEGLQRLSEVIDRLG